MRNQRPARIAVAAAAYFLLAAAAAAGPMAYVPNEGSGSVSVIDTERTARACT